MLIQKKYVNPFCFALTFPYLCIHKLLEMLAHIVEEAKVKQVRNLLDNAQEVVITSHVSPDGDAIGSSLALFHVLSAIGKSVHVISPDLLPQNLMFLQGAEDILVFTRYSEFATKLIDNADLIFCLDFNSYHRLDKMEEVVRMADASKVLIDHHPDPDDFADVVISHPEISSTSMLLFRILCRLGFFNVIDKQAAEGIYVGMMTDTGNFTYNSNDPDLYVVISELLKKGVDKDRLYTLICNTNSPSKLQLIGYAIYKKMQLFPAHHAALITLAQDELKEFDYQKGDTENLVNIPLSIPDIHYSLFMRDDVNYIKISARSSGDFPVNVMCEKYFGGGGHKNASGGEYYGALDDAINLFLSIMGENDKYFNKID